MTEKGNPIRATDIAIIILLIISIVISGLSYQAIIDLGPKPKGYTFALMAKDMGADWWLAYIGAGKWYLESKGHEVVIGNPEYSEAKANSILKTWAANPDIDAAIISGMGVEAIVGGIKDMADAGKLVIITNCEAGYVPEVPFSIMFDSDWGGSAGAEKIVEELTERYGSPQGTVILSICDPANPDLNERAEGYRSIFNQYPNIEVHEVSAPIDRVAGAKTQATTLLRTLPKVDAMGSVEYEGTMGLLAALEDEGMLLPIGDPNHVIFTCIDGGPGPVNDALSEDKIDLVIDQPVMAYNALAAYYALKILGGETVEFQVGQTITADDVDCTYIVPGTGLTEPGTTWAPATVIDVTTEYGHVRLGTSALLLTKEDLADPTLWSNIAAIKDVTGWGF